MVEYWCMADVLFSPTDYCFEWGTNGWHKWDSVPAHKAAKAARNGVARVYKEYGYKFTKFSIPRQYVHKNDNDGTEVILCCRIYGISMDTAVVEDDSGCEDAG